MGTGFGVGGLSGRSEGLETGRGGSEIQELRGLTGLRVVREVGLEIWVVLCLYPWRLRVDSGFVGTDMNGRYAVQCLLQFSRTWLV